jgi:polar amino acid transport system substrate-binding protein
MLSLCLLCLGATGAMSAGPHFVVAHDATWPPMEFMDQQRKIVGYSVEYIDAVAKEAGFTVEHKSVAWDGIFAGLAGKKYDIISSSVTITAERGRVMDFSTPYYEVRQALLTPKDAVVEKLEDMKGKRVGAQIGTTGFMAIKKIAGIDVVTYDEIGLAMADLDARRIDAVICDDPVATNYILDNADYAAKMKVALIVPSDEPEYYGFAVAKGNRDTLELLNTGISLVKEKGIEAELRKKWIGQ